MSPCRRSPRGCGRAACRPSPRSRSRRGRPRVRAFQTGCARGSRKVHGEGADARRHAPAPAAPQSGTIAAGDAQPFDFAGIARHRRAPVARDAELVQRPLDDHGAPGLVDAPDVGGDAAGQRREDGGPFSGENARADEKVQDLRPRVSRRRFVPHAVLPPVLRVYSPAFRVRPQAKKLRPARWSVIRSLRRREMILPLRGRWSSEARPEGVAFGFNCLSGPKESATPPRRFAATLP